MSFGAPSYLWFLLLLPASAAVLAAWLIWRGEARRRFGSAIQESPWPYVVAALLVAAIGFTAFAAARPQFGEREERIEDRGIDLVIVLDTSQSMFSTDTQPSRLRRAQDEIRSLLERMQGDRVGLVVFAGRPFIRSPLTSDTQALSRLVDGVDRELALVPPGSDMGSAILEALEVLEGGEAESKAMLLISDGEDHVGLIEGPVRDASAAGITVFTAGVGSEQGAPVLDIDPVTREARPRVDASGQPVMTRLEPAALRLIASTGGGRYVELSGDGRPLAGLAADFDELAATTFDVEQRPQRIERFQIFAGIALALLVAATLAPALGWLRRSGEARPGARGIRRLWPLGAAGLLIGAACVSRIVELNSAANVDYAQGEYAEALAGYRTAQAIDPERKELYHNAGNALGQLGEYARAIEETRKGLPADDELAALLEYAIGHHYASNSEFREAYEAYKRSLIENPDDEDAKHNLEVVLRRLRESPTPSPTPTAPPPEVTPTIAPGDDDQGTGGTQGDGDATPQQGDQADATPGTGGTPGPGEPSDEMTPEELERALQDALQGIDEEFTLEEALRVLDLLERRNRSTLEEREGGTGGSGSPDY